MADYPPPLSQLLTLGKPDFSEWRDYAALGIGPEHVPDLIRMAVDLDLNEAESETTRVWAPVHAWRVLGELRAAEAVEPLLHFLAQSTDEHDDWAMDDLPRVFARIGAPALLALKAFLADPGHDEYARWAAADAIKGIAQEYPELRGECVAALVEQLARTGDNELSLNGGVVADLMNLEATEAAEAIEQAFATGNVDESICGDWPYVRYELGLGPQPSPRRYVPVWSGGFGGPGGRSPKNRAKERARARRKQANKSRKQNRKKKKK